MEEGHLRRLEVEGHLRRLEVEGDLRRMEELGGTPAAIGGGGGTPAAIGGGGGTPAAIGGGGRPAAKGGGGTPSAIGGGGGTSAAIGGGGGTPAGIGGGGGTPAAIGGESRAAAASCDNGSGSVAMGSSSSPLLSYIFPIRSWRSISVLDYCLLLSNVLHDIHYLGNTITSYTHTIHSNGSRPSPSHCTIR